MALPNTFVEKLKSGKIVPFVGAGVSMAVKTKGTDKSPFPSWKQLLEAAIEKLNGDNKTRFATLSRASLSSGDYLSAARWADEGLKGQLIDLIKEKVDISETNVEPSSLELARLIWQLGSPYLITTNYDWVLEWAGAKNCRSRLNRHKFELKQIVSGDISDNAVWHLHGHVDDGDSLILTPKSYARLYLEGDQDIDWKAALTTLRTIIASKSLLFIGYGLGDEQIIEQLNEIEEIFGGASGPHYIVATEALKLNIEAKELNVEVISYESHGEPLLKLIKEMVASRTSVTSPVSLTEFPTVKIASYDPQFPPFNVPFRPKGKLVLGREDQLHLVREQLLSGQPTEIGQTASFDGIGGLGKTQLAVEYAYEFRGQYPNGVVWITADGDIDSQLTELAQISRWVASESDHKTKLEIAQHRILSYSDYLLIFDNVEDLAAIEKYLPQHPATPHLLITSRAPQVGFTSIPLELLNSDVSLALLIQESSRKSLNESDLEAANQIVELLGHLPLAIELAGAYLKYRPTFPLESYRDLLAEDLEAALPPAGRFRGFTRHEASLYKTLHVDESIFELEPLLRDVLDVLTWSGAVPMSEELLRTLLEANSPHLKSALAVGVDLKLLQKTSELESYSLHRLVRQVRQSEIPLDNRTEWVKTISRRLGDWFESKREDFNQLHEYEREIKHLVAWQENSRVLAIREYCRMFWLQAYPAYHRGRYLESKLSIDNALCIYEKSQIDDKNLKANLLSDKGLLEGNLGNHNESLFLIKQALDIRMGLSGEQHSDTAKLLNNLGGVYQDLGQPQKALELYERALEVRQELFGEQHPNTANSLGNLGSVYQRLGQPQKALELYERALEVQQELFGEQHPNTITSLGNLGSVYLDLGQPQKALELREKALEVRQELFGEQHPTTANSLGSLGSVYRDLGQPQKALELYERALEIQQELFGEQHPNTANSLGNLGGIYRELGQPQKALKLRERVLEIQQELFGEQHPATANSLGNLGNVYQDLGQPQKALELYERALKVQQELFGERHPDTATSLGNLGSAYQNLGQPQKALKLRERALEIQQEIFGEQHPDTVILLDSLGGVYQDLGQPQKALELREKALEIQQELFGEQHPTTAMLLNNLGGVYRDLGQLQKALKLYERALEIQQELFGEQHPNTANSLGNLGGIYQRLGQPQKALKLRERALKVQQELLGEQHPTTANSLSKLGVVYLELDKLSLAAEFFQQPYIIYSSAKGIDHPDTINVLYWLTDTLGKLKRHREAFNQLDATLVALPLAHKEFKSLEYRAINFLKSFKSQVGIKQVTEKYKYKWRHCKKT